MGRRLATAVHVLGRRGPLDFVVLQAGTEVPDEYADQVTAEQAYLPDNAELEQETPDTGAPAEPAPDGGYATWTNEALSDELRRRDLAHTGPKATLVARLVDDDAHRKPDTGDEEHSDDEQDDEGPDKAGDDSQHEQ